MGTLFESASTWIQAHPLGFAVILLVAVGFAIWQPKTAMQIVIIALVLAAAGYIVSFLWDLTSSGLDETNKLKGVPRTG